MVFIRYPFQCSLKYMHLADGSLYSVDVIKNEVSCHLGVDDFLLYYNGQKLLDGGTVPDDASIQVVLPLPGGKGGFGSMLRAIGAQIEKTTNREACRDLSGRRLRDINEEQRLKKWLAKEAEREAEKARRRKERLERLKTKPKHNFVDFEYEKEISTLPERIDDALTEGLQKAKNPPAKREACESPVLSKKKRLWIEEDLENSSSSDSDSQQKSSNDSHSSTSKQGCSSLGFSISESSTSNSNFPTEMNENSCENNDHSVSICESSDPSEPSASNSSLNFNVCKNNYEDSQSFAVKSDLDSNSKFPEILENSTSDVLEVGTKINISCQVNENSTNNSDYDNFKHENRDNSVSVSKLVSRNSDASCNLTSVNENKAEENNIGNNSPVSSLMSILPPPKSQEESSSIDLMKYQTVEELAALGLERLKYALVAQGLKCGGNVTDRAQRLWKIRGLQPHEYPANLFAKSKK